MVTTPSASLSKVLASWDLSQFPDVYGENRVLLGRLNEMMLSSASEKSRKDLGATPRASNRQQELEMLRAASFVAEQQLTESYSP